MNVKRIIRRVTDNDYLFTIFTKILAVLIGLVASFYSNRFLGPQLKGELGAHFLAAFHCGGDGELWSVSAVSLLQAAG
ncbi:MAG: hypothetical protein ACLR4A_14855 [Christensenellales bacterium]